MHTTSTPTPLTFGKLLARAIILYPTHRGIFLRTAAIFYLPVAALAIIFVKDAVTSTLFLTLIFPVEAIMSLSLIALCVELLHGRPLAVRTAVQHGLRRLLANIGMILAASAVYIGAVILLAIPIWVGLIRTDIALGEILDAFSGPPGPADIEAIMIVLDDVLLGGIGLCLSGVLALIVLSYLSARWMAAEVALMVEETGPLDSLARSWNLSRGYILRTVGYSLLLAIPLGLVAGLFGVTMEFVVLPVFPAIDEPSKAGFSGAASILLTIFTTPFYVTAVVLYYFDLRVRKEKYDFENV